MDSDENLFKNLIFFMKCHPKIVFISITCLLEYLCFLICSPCRLHGHDCTVIKSYTGTDVPVGAVDQAVCYFLCDSNSFDS